MKPDLSTFSMYELVVELEKRLKKTNGITFLSARQLLVVSRTFIEELSKRANPKIKGLSNILPLNKQSKT